MSTHTGHQHTSHDGHDHAAGANERQVLAALVLTGGFMFAEVIGGIIAGSLALIADAGHMLTDAAALALTFAAFRAGRWPRDRRRTFGYQRFQVIAAFVNGLTLIAVVVWIVIEAIRRLFAPIEVMGGLMLAVAAAGLVVNLAAFWILTRGGGDNLNLQGAAVHVLGDLLGSVAAIVAAVVIMMTGWTPIDPLLSVVVAALILRSAWRLVGRAGHILLEGAPEGLDIDSLRAELVSAVPEVSRVHHVHAWMLTNEAPLITLHAVVAPDADHNAVLGAIQTVLADRFGITHATIQIEPDDPGAAARTA